MHHANRAFGYCQDMIDLHAEFREVLLHLVTGLPGASDEWMSMIKMSGKRLDRLHTSVLLWPHFKAAVNYVVNNVSTSSQHVDILLNASEDEIDRLSNRIPFVEGFAIWLKKLTRDPVFIQRECVIYCKSSGASGFRDHSPSKCTHTPDTCCECINHWISSELESENWDRIRCSECPTLLQYADVMAFASLEVFERYEAVFYLISSPALLVFL